MDMDNLGIKVDDNAWQSGVAREITFIVTKDCQLACKYCYLVGKNSKERMSWKIAKKVIDYVLNFVFYPNRWKTSFLFNGAICHKVI